MTNRLRPVAYIVQPQFMVDDGETLTPLPVQPLTLPAAEWPNVVSLVAEAVEQLRQRVEGDTEPPARPEHNGRVTKSPRKRVSPIMPAGRSDGPMT